MVIPNRLYNRLYDDIHVCIVKCIPSVWLYASLYSKNCIWRYRAPGGQVLAFVGPAEAQASTRSLMDFPKNEGYRVVIEKRS